MSLPQGPYNAHLEESEILNEWLDKKIFKPEYDPTSGKVQSLDEMKKDPREAWALICPPPNAYARPHIGNISGYAYQDAMARYARMQGKKVLVLPGKDHAGLEGEGVFVREVLEKQGRSKFDMKREDFYAEMMEYFNKYMEVAMNDEKKIGLSADYDRNIFTLDPRVVDTVLNTFVEMYKAGKIYKGVRIVNWDPKARSAVADNQTVREERDGKLYYVKYPLVKQKAWKLNFRDEYSFNRILQKEKTIETRADNPEEPDKHFKDIRIGDLVICIDKTDQQRSSIYKKVKQVEYFTSLDESLNKLNWQDVAGKSFSSATELNDWYSKLAEGYADKISKNGLVAIELEDLQDNDYLTVATTRPGTLFGDTAVAMNPSNQLYKEMQGYSAVVPLVDRIVPIISSYKVEEGFGTGFLKVTPAHSQDDYQIMTDWNNANPDKKIEAINVIDTYLKMCGPIPQKFVGRKYKEILEEVITDLKTNNLFVREESTKQNILIAERTKAPIEPLLSSQWYLKYDGIKEAAIDMVKNGEVKIHPKNMEDKFFHWMDNLRDWAISRSLWWGYRLPVWYAGKVTETIDENGKVKEQIELRNENGELRMEELDYTNPDHLKVQLESPGEGWIQDENVLDTWFSSGQWVYATLGAFNLMDTFFPTKVLVSAYDILENWDSRMMMFTYFHEKNIPFENLFLTGLVLGTDGQKMSKSKGNMIDMDKIVADYGTDSVRLAYFYQNKAGSNYAMTYDKLKNFKQFINKLWNASRFVLSHSAGITNYEVRITNLKLELSKTIVKHIQETKEKVTKNIEEYEFGYATESLYDSFWKTFCDVYIEDSKKYTNTIKDKEGNIISEPNTDEKSEIQQVLVFALKEYIKMLHPFIPFVTERIWKEVPKTDGDNEFVMYSRF